MPVRVAVDAMGGDHAPRAIVRGAVQALALEPDAELLLVGDEGSIVNELRAIDSYASQARIQIRHTSQVVGMDEPALEAIRGKKDSSIIRMAELATTGQADAVVSAGNTGACAAACQLLMKPLEFITRPGIAVTIPSFHGPYVICDVGANIQAKPQHLHEYAIMAGLYAERVHGIANPRVALLSIGEEDGKGTGLVKKSHELLRADKRINFVGNAEGRELFEGKCDVAVCDGFVGNIVLKFVEGLAEGLFKTVAREFDGESADLRSKVISAIDAIRRRHDYSEYGGAPLLGVNGVCIICHGRSNEYAICNAVKAAVRFVHSRFNDTLRTRMN